MTAPATHGRTLSGSDLSGMRLGSSAPAVKPPGTPKAAPSATAISVRAGPKGSPLSKEPAVLNATTMASAFSTASESELLACGMTADEVEDLELLTKGPRVKAQALGRGPQAGAGAPPAR